MVKTVVLNLLPECFCDSAVKVISSHLSNPRFTHMLVLSDQSSVQVSVHYVSDMFDMNSSRFIESVRAARSSSVPFVNESFRPVMYRGSIDSCKRSDPK